MVRVESHHNKKQALNAIMAEADAAYGGKQIVENPPSVIQPQAEAFFLTRKLTTGRSLRRPIGLKSE